MRSLDSIDTNGQPTGHVHPIVDGDHTVDFTRHPAEVPLPQPDATQRSTNRAGYTLVTATGFFAVSEGFESDFSTSVPVTGAC